MASLELSTHNNLLVRRRASEARLRSGFKSEKDRKSAARGGNLSLLDFALLVAQSPTRPQDFTLLLNLERVPSLEALRIGARSARNLYATTGSYIQKNQWWLFTHQMDEVGEVEVASSEEVTTAVEQFIDRPFDPHSQPPVQQQLIRNCVTADLNLVSRFHHAAADGLSAAMWLGHQLRVAFGKEAVISQVAPFEDLPLRIHPAPIKRSRFAFSEPADRLWTSSKNQSPARRWLTIRIEATDLRRRCPRIGGFSYNDLLVTCALEVFSLWNREHCDCVGQKVGIWLPINIRRRAAAGFGNGTSRIRVYASYPKHTSLTDKCRAVRRQVSWSISNGEWSVPAGTILNRFPSSAASRLIRCYINRPRVDVGTAVFSHVDNWPVPGKEILSNFTRVEGIGQLHSRHSLAINAVTYNGQTWLTFTYDPGLLSCGDVHRLQEIYQDQIAQARQELS